VKTADQLVVAKAAGEWTGSPVELGARSSADEVEVLPDCCLILPKLGLGASWNLTDP
jgi:hypothetical protein